MRPKPPGYVLAAVTYGGVDKAWCPIDLFYLFTDAAVGTGEGLVDGVACVRMVVKLAWILGI
jgi:hypothetical protein